MSKNNKIPEEVLEKEILDDENSDCAETKVDEPEDKKTYGIVCGCDKLRLRAEPNVDSRIISELPKHTRVSSMKISLMTNGFMWKLNLDLSVIV